MMYHYWYPPHAAYYAYSSYPPAAVVHGHPSLPMQAGRAQEAVTFYTNVYGAVLVGTTERVRDSPDGPIYTQYTLRLGPENDGRALYFQVDSRECPVERRMRDMDMWIYVTNPEIFVARAVAGGCIRTRKYDNPHRYYIRIQDPFGIFWCVGRTNMIPYTIL